MFKKISESPEFKVIKIDLPENERSFSLVDILDYLNSIGTVYIKNILEGVQLRVDTKVIDLNKLHNKLKRVYNCSIQSKTQNYVELDY